MLFWCWPTDGGPTSKQHRVNALGECLVFSGYRSCIWNSSPCLPMAASGRARKPPTEAETHSTQRQTPWRHSSCNNVRVPWDSTYCHSWHAWVSAPARVRSSRSHPVSSPWRVRHDVVCVLSMWNTWSWPWGRAGEERTSETPPASVMYYP